MPAYLVYMLKASAGLSAIYFFYIILFKGITYYTPNRYFLIFFSLLACMVPFINVNILVNSGHWKDVSFLRQLPVVSAMETTTNNSAVFPVYNVFLIAFFAGLLVSLIRLFIQLLSLWTMHVKATLLQDGDIKLYNLAEPIVPFSYFNNVYVNKDNYSSADLNEIIQHELVHVKQKHTIDMLIIEIICMLNWYNPFVWMLKKAIKENLEFIADDSVIKKGADKKKYQYLLLKVTGDVSFSIANNLNYSSLKNRIFMINKTKSNRLHLLKFAFVIPAATILLLSFRNKQEIENKHYEQTATTKKYILSSLTYSIADKKVEGIVKKDQKECLLKTGEDLNIELVLKEHARLKDLLEKYGYDNIGNHAIVFMVDTTLGNNSFSIQVNINLAKTNVTKGINEPADVSKTSASYENTKNMNASKHKQNTRLLPFSFSAEEETNAVNTTLYNKYSTGK